jgi:hypothetical protein
VWQAYSPAIYVRILEIRGVKQLDHGLLCTNVCAPTISATLKVLGPKTILVHVIAIPQIPMWQKICHFPELRISQK